MQTFQVYSVPGPSEPGGVSNVTLANSVNLGERWFYQGEEYVYVYNAGVQQISVGRLAVLSANSGFSVTVSSITSNDVAIGFVKHATITTGAYGWLLTQGFVQAANAMPSTGFVTGAVLAVGTQGGVYEHTGAYTCPVVGIAVSSVGSGGCANSQALAYVRCFGS